ncbi:ricin-type beta-trefoil lectin domain protein [Longispora fulva]|uniref:RHS repeat-associated protein n=1 Tax=Longispora fulva TaxID=619741 RepID=A0A8J7GBL8_9ACTN|nr:ricin-type beta-trefoil lectin domain protein [Longispora fulva]MBG6134501.1 RHS repeat-associated protein [Longispora fulva]
MSEKSVAVRPVAGRGAAPSEGPVPLVDHKDVPAGGAGSVTVSADAAGAVVGGLSIAAAPVQVAVEPRKTQGSLAQPVERPAASPSSVRVEVADQKVARAAGVAGVVLSVARADGAASTGPTRLRLDYSGWAKAFGADYANRLRLYALPACALKTPERRECQTRTDLGAVNAGGALTAEVGVPATSTTADGSTGAGPAGRLRSGAGTMGLRSEAAPAAAPMVLAAAASSSSAAGSFTQTSLSQASSWAAGSSGGGFSYTYPLSVPPGVGGPVPNLALAYSSSATDAETLAANGQTSWLGEGFDLSGGGFIERSYRSCDQQGYVATVSCWMGENASMVFNGRSQSLVFDKASSMWRAGDDSGLRVERLYDATSGSGALNGEYWKVTTTDGAAYYFGRHKRYATDTAVTNSVQTEVVFGLNAGDPCYVANNPGWSGCRQAYRWNLDYVVDPRGNSMTYFYSKYSGYSQVAISSNIWQYDLAANLDHIDYGTRAGSEGSGSAPARVDFAAVNRCGQVTCVDADYWDTPLDLYCGSASSCPNTPSPVFFNKYRLAQISTKVLSGGSYRNVDVWSFSHAWPGTPSVLGNTTGGDASPNMWLRTIFHTGYAADGAGADAPAVWLGAGPGSSGAWQSYALANRVSYGSNIGVGALFHYRLGFIDYGTGSNTLVTYAGAECPNQGAMPLPDANPYRCFQQWIKPQIAAPDFAWFQKYVVTQVVDRDLVGASPDEVTSYAYSTAGTSDTALWRHDAGEAVPLANRTWSQWAGYPTVTTTHGAAGGPQTVSRALYHRGFNGDGMASGDWTSRAWGARKVGLVTPVLPASGISGQAGMLAGAGGMCLNVVAGATTNGTLVSVDPCTGGPEQVWVRKTNTPTTQLVNPQSGRCLSYDPANTANTSIMSLWDCGNGTGQQWQYQSDGSWKNPTSGRCLSPSDAGSNPHATAWLWDCTQAPNQRWTPRADGGWTVNQANRCVDVANAGTANGTAVQVYDCHGGTNQIWQPQPNGTLLNPVSGRCLTVNDSGGTPKGRPAYLWDCNTPLTGQIFIPQTNGTVKNPNSGLCLDPTTNPLRNAPLQVTDCTGAPTQQWTTRVEDTAGLDGALRETDQLDGAQVSASTINVTTTKVNATRPAAGSGGPDVTARQTLNTATRTRTWIAATGTWRQTGTDTAYDAYSLPTDVTNYGDFAVTDDDTCTHTDYARDTAAKYLINFPSQAVTTTCGQVSGDGDVLAGTQTLYDGGALNVAPTKGLANRTNALADLVAGVRTWKQSGRAGYDANGRVVDSWDALDRHTGTAYTPATGGPVTSMAVTNNAGWTTTSTIEPGRGQPTSVVDANGKKTQATLDPLGRVTAAWAPGRTPGTDTPNTAFSYVVTGSAAPYVKTSRLGPAGNTYDSYAILDGRLRARQSQTPVQDGTRSISDTAYDSAGRAFKTSSFKNNTSGPSGTLVGFNDADIASQNRITFDGLGRVATNQLFAWGYEQPAYRTTTSYDGDRVTVTPPAGGTATTTFLDARGRTTTVRQFLGNLPAGGFQDSTYGYDRLGRPRWQKDVDGNTWNTTYDLRGRVKAKTDPDAGTTTPTYDDAGQLSGVTDGRGAAVAYKYDVLGRKTLVKNATTGVTLASWTFDNLLKGQLDSSSRFEGADEYKTSVTGYDNGYRPTGTSVTVPNSAGTLAGTYNTSLTYTADGQVYQIGYPAAGGLAAETVSNTYNTIGQLIGVAGTTGYSDRYLSDVWYYHDGGISQRTLGDPATGKRVKVTTLRDDVTLRTTSNQVHTEHPGGPDTWDQQLVEAYSYDPAGNVKGLRETVTGTTGGNPWGTVPTGTVSQQCFTYDGLRRMTEAWTTTADTCQASPSTGVTGGPDPYWTSYTFERTGGRLTETKHAVTGGPVTSDTVRTNYTPAAQATRPHTVTRTDTTVGGGASATTDTYSYDDAGNTKTHNGYTYTYNELGKLSTVTNSSGPTTSFVYDADGNRILRKDSTGTTLYLGGTELHADTPTSAVTCVRTYSTGAVRTAGGLTWMTADHHGTAQTTINASTLALTRRKTDPYGNPRGTAPTSWPDQKGFVGGAMDADTGLTHLGARDYDPKTGRFTTVDPLFDSKNPQSWNGYSYAGGNPVTMSDPDGRRAVDPDTGRADDRNACGARTVETLQQINRVVTARLRTAARKGENDDGVLSFGKKAAAVAGAAGASRYVTAPDAAYFWSGRTYEPNGSFVDAGPGSVADGIASRNGGITLEMLMKQRGIVLPPWDAGNPDVVRAWEQASAEYAAHASGHVRVVLGENLRGGNIWDTEEYDRLMSNPKVTKITVIGLDGKEQGSFDINRMAATAESAAQAEMIAAEEIAMAEAAALAEERAIFLLEELAFVSEEVGDGAE